MNGNTVVVRSAPLAFPDDATAAPLRSVRRTYGSVAAPTVSTAPAQRAESSGRPGAVTSSRPRKPAAPSARQPVVLVGLAGRRPDLVTALGEDRDGGRSHAARRAGHQHRSVARAQAALLEGRDAHRRREPGRPDRHRLARRQAVGHRHDPARGDARVGRVPTMARRPDVVAVGEHRRPDRDGRILRRRHRPREVDAGHQRVRARHPPVLAGREAVLEVHPGPLDPHGDLARRQVGRGELARGRARTRRPPAW